MLEESDTNMDLAVITMTVYLYISIHLVTSVSMAGSVWSVTQGSSGTEQLGAGCVSLDMYWFTP